jgi:PAS domain S-box-containing protein
MDSGGTGDVLWRVLSGALEVSREATIVVDDQRMIFWLNRAAERVFGCGRESLVGQPIGRVLPEWDDARSLHEPSGVSSGRTESATVRSKGKRFDDNPIAVEMRLESIEFGGRIWTSCAIKDADQKSDSERLVDRLSQRLENLKRLEQASTASHHPRRLASALLDHLKLMMPCWGIVIWIFDFASRTAEVVATVGERETPRPVGSIVPLDLFGLSDIAELYAERDVNVRETREAPNLAPVISELIPLGLRAVARIPLSADARLIGALEIQFDEPDTFDPDQLEIAHEAAEQLGVAIRHAILFQEVRSSRERLRTLSRQLLKTQEEERRHLSRELHDEIGQSLTAVRINLQQAIGHSELDGGVGLLKECDALVHHVLQQVRDLSLDLRPSVLDDLGLVASIRWYLDRMARRAGLKGYFAADPPEIRAVADIETTCFRVAQEAVTNIVRHAKAREVEIHLNRIGARLELTIRDDGAGFDVAGARKRALQGESLGIIGMQERVELVGGRISIDSLPGRGTEIRARIPLEVPARPGEHGAGWEA